MNLYGPSEDTTYSTGAAIPRGASQIPIGWPLPGTAALVADDALTPLPVGIPGELLLGGVGVADGYLNDPRRTAERFLPDPFAATPGARLYATGDLAIDGEAEGLRWAGRRDGQVKVRGYRIELAEIENALRGDPAVHDAAVVVRGAGTPTADLVAFVTPPAAATDAAALRARLGRTLPDWMVPYPIRGLDALPLTANGKRDRTALLEVAERLAAGPALGEGPRDDLEQRLSAIWRPLLRVDHLGRDESVFARGAHSLTVAEFVARAEETLGLVVSLRSVFDAPTVAQLAAHLREQPARAIDHAADLERLLAEIEGLSEEEASRRLARLDPEPGGSP
jgi:acyl carrier protein